MICKLTFVRLLTQERDDEITMVEKYSQEVSTFESVLSPRSPYEFIVLCLLTVAINILSNAIGGGVIIAVSSVVVIALFIIWWVLFGLWINCFLEQHFR